MTHDMEANLSVPVVLGHHYTVQSNVTVLTKEDHASLMLNLPTGGEVLYNLLEAGLVGLSFSTMSVPELPEQANVGRTLGWEILIANLIKCWQESDGTTVSPELYFALTNIVMYKGDSEPKEVNADSTGFCKCGHESGWHNMNDHQGDTFCGQTGCDCQVFRKWVQHG